MIIDFTEMPSDRVYHCMTQSLIPRPVAWVLSENPEGDYNLAPFSFFTAVTSNPPLIMLSVGRKPDGDFKDTRVNIEERKKFVIHIAHDELARTMTETARSLPHGVSEVAQNDLKTVPFDGFDLPRLADCKIALACELYQLQELGPNRQSVIFGQVSQLYVDDAAATRDEKDRFRIDAEAIQPIGRLGGSEYMTFGEILSIPRPS
ncbi:MULTISPECIES: flavin reductase family protein [Marinobacter]|uniref:flavin reductase family protein n=1 Tax=Marinobacter TaxID=2742 RepID=UPI000DAEEC9D|nr:MULTISPECIES: flavin reductase family protein [Marinobacter]